MTMTIFINDNMYCFNYYYYYYFLFNNISNGILSLLKYTCTFIISQTNKLTITIPIK
jgi:hypothetical protein